MKSLIFAKIVFVSFLTNIPKLIVKNLIKLKNDFLWDGKPPKVKHSAMIGSYEKGGLKDIDIERRIKALRLSWVRRLYDETDHEWKLIPKFYSEKFSTNLFFPNLKININNKLPALTGSQMEAVGKHMNNLILAQKNYMEDVNLKKSR